MTGIREYVGLVTLILAWGCALGLVAYRITYRPTCAPNEIMVPRSERPLSGWRCYAVGE